MLPAESPRYASGIRQAKRFNPVSKERHENMDGGYLEGPDFIFLNQIFELECKVPVPLVENVEQFF